MLRVGFVGRKLINVHLILAIMFKVTVLVGTDQNIEIEIFAEYKYTSNELLVKKNVCQYV